MDFIDAKIKRLLIHFLYFLFQFQIIQKNVTAINENRNVIQRYAIKTNIGY